MRFFILFLVIIIFTLPLSAKSVYCDADSDCYYVPQKVINSNKPAPALLYLSCTGAIKSDLDSIKFIADSLGWILFSCHQSRNHRDVMLNDKDIMKTYYKLIKNYKIDTMRIFIYGFSGQGVQSLMEMFLHPTKFRGVHTVCAHTGAMSLAKWSSLKGHLAFLISREKDWNLQQNYQIDQAFKINGVKDTLVITPGEHGIGDKYEIFRAVKWLRKNLK